MPLLEPVGQFGTRASGGDDAAAPRYISTRLSSVTRLLFRKEDDEVLNLLAADGVSAAQRCHADTGMLSAAMLRTGSSAERRHAEAG